MTIPDTAATATVPAPAATPPVPTPPAPSPAAGEPVPLHDDPVIAKALEGLTDEQRETLLTQGGKSALTKAKEARVAAQQAAQTAADTARTELAQQLGKALGLVEDDTTDPAKLTEALTASQAQTKQANLELAVFRIANGVADAGALLDSRSFLAKVADIDPTDAAALGAAITEAVTANPAFAVQTGSRLPAPSPAVGSSASGAPDLEAQIAEAQKNGDIRTVIALQNQKLRTT